MAYIIINISKMEKYYYVSILVACNKIFPALICTGNSYNDMVTFINKKYDLDLGKCEHHTIDNNDNSDDDYDDNFVDVLVELSYEIGHQFIIPKDKYKKCLDMHPAGIYKEHDTCICSIYIYKIVHSEDEIIDLANILGNVTVY